MVTGLRTLLQLFVRHIIRELSAKLTMDTGSFSAPCCIYTVYIPMVIYNLEQSKAGLHASLLWRTAEVTTQ
jgi:hypothetical protein